MKSKAAADAAARRAARAAMMLLAPADEYFGPLKQSFLGIRNTIRDIGARYDVNHDTAPQSLASAALTERSIVDWEKKYPRDHGIPVQIFSLQRLYNRVLTPAGREKAQATAKWLIGRYPNSPQGRQMRILLATEVPPPLEGPSPLAMPSPTASGPAPNGASPSPFATPSPSTAVTPIPVSSPTH